MAPTKRYKVQSGTVNVVDKKGQIVAGYRATPEGKASAQFHAEMLNSGGDAQKARRNILRKRMRAKLLAALRKRTQRPATKQEKSARAKRRKAVLRRYGL